MEFTKESLISLLLEDEHNIREPENRQCNYLGDYLKALGVSAIVVEGEYVDGDFLDDVAHYYVRCHRTYPRFCRRLHFFRQLTMDQFVGLSSGRLGVAQVEELKRGYCGFVVARPLPDAVIGRSMLRLPDDVVTQKLEEAGDRVVRAVKDYAAHLFGVSFPIRSLAFQEQDTVIAACATSALWSAFHKTSDLWGHETPRPYAITTSATKYQHTSRSIPSAGLSIIQLCEAIRSIGLEAQSFEVWDEDSIKNMDAEPPYYPKIPFLALCYAYLRALIPIVLVVDVERGRESGLHAVTLAGYRLGPKYTIPDEVLKAYPQMPNLPLTGSKIERFYAHDDQVGPFSELIVATNCMPEAVRLRSAWDEPGKQPAFFPTLVLIPLYTKIRVPFTEVLRSIGRINKLFTASAALKPGSWEWDLYLVENKSYKQEAQEHWHVDLPDRARILDESLPRFLWRSQLLIGGVGQLDLLADATDTARSTIFSRIVVFNPEIGDLVLRLLKSFESNESARGAFGGRLQELLSKALQNY